jgi:hypothetical protein
MPFMSRRAADVMRAQHFVAVLLAGFAVIPAPTISTAAGPGEAGSSAEVLDDGFEAK